MLKPIRLTVVCCVALAAAGARAEAPAALTLPAAIAEGARNHPLVQMSAAQAASAQALVYAARGALGPRVTVTARHFRTGPIPSFEVETPDGPQTVTVGSPQTTTGSLGLLLPLDWSGQLRTAADAQALQALAAEAAHDRVLQDVALLVEVQFLTALRAQALLGVAEASLAADEEHLRVARARFGAGAAPEFDVLRAEVEVADGQQAKVAAQAAVQSAYAALNRALGRPVEGALTLAPAASDAAMRLPEDSAARARRPELAEAQAQRRAAELGIRLAGAGRAPVVTAGATYSGDVNPSGFAGRPLFWDVSLTVALPIFDSGVTRARQASAAALLAAATARVRDVEAQVDLEVRTARLDLGAAEERVRAAASAVSQAEEARRIARVRYEAGLGTPVELTDATVALTRARTNQVNAQYDVLLSRARVRRALGASQEEPAQ